MAKRGAVSKSAVREEEKRPVRWRRYPHLFLIVCEDGNTEPYYFEKSKEQIPAETIFLRAIGTGRNSKGVVEQAVIEREKLANEANKNVDEVWVVFDKDDADQVPALAARFHEAFKIAQQEKISVAYSNEVFELWLLLHFVDIDAVSPIPRAEIYKRLEAAIRAFGSYEMFAYEHGKTAVIDAVCELGDENKAIQRAENLLFELKSKPVIDANPSTKVHQLVRRLRDLIAYWSFSPA